LVDFDLHAEKFLAEFHKIGSQERKEESTSDSAEKKGHALILHQATQNPHGSWRYHISGCISLALMKLLIKHLT